MLAMAAASWALLPCWGFSPGLSSSPAAPAPPPAYSNSSCPGRPNPPFSGAGPLSVAPLLIAARSPAPPPLGTGLLRIASGLSMLLGRVYCSRRSANSAEVWSHGIAPVSIMSLRTLSAASESWGRASAEGEGRESGGGDMAPIRLSRSDSCIIECRRSEGPGRPAQSRNMVSRLPRGRVEAGGWATPSPRAGVKGWPSPPLSSRTRGGRGGQRPAEKVVLVADRRRGVVPGKKGAVTQPGKKLTQRTRRSEQTERGQHQTTSVQRSTSQPGPTDASNRGEVMAQVFSSRSPLSCAQSGEMHHARRGFPFP